MSQDGSRLTVVNSFLHAWAANDTDGVLGLFAEDAVFIASLGDEPGQTYRGQGEIAPAVARMLAAANGTRFHVREIIPFADGAVVTWSVDGVAAATGQVMNAKGIDIFRVRDGAITFKDAYRKVGI